MLRYLMRRLFPKADAADAVASHRRTSTATEPQALAALFSKGAAEFKNGQFDAAAVRFQQVIDLCHDHAAAYNALGLCMQRLGRGDDAQDCFLTAAAFAPEDADAPFNLAILAVERGSIGEACALFEQALSLCPDHPRALNNLGYLLCRERGQMEAGERMIRRALELDPGFADAHCNLGWVLQAGGQFKAAITEFDLAVGADPTLAEARLNRGVANLALGRFDRAWDDYEARKIVPGHYQRRPFRFPEWNGDRLNGRTLLIHAEQGLGDEIMFASCLVDLLAMDGRYIVECDPKLEGLFRRSFPSAIVHGGAQSDTDVRWLDALAPIDCQVAIGSLSRLFRGDISRFPDHAGYLKADPVRVERWRERLAALGPGRKVGLSWRGGTPRTRGALRSMTSADLGVLLGTPDCVFVSLQYDPGIAEIAAMRDSYGAAFAHWEDGIADYEETAALICALDLVVSVCTAVVHLAGALGRPVWVLVPAIPEWRYRDEGDAMPWYPGVRLIRRGDSDKDWIRAITEVSRCIAGALPGTSEAQQKIK